MAEEVPKLQYKNPYVQILINKNESPSPYINIFYGKHWTVRVVKCSRAHVGDGSIVHIDTDGITSDEILTRVEAIAAKRE